MSALDLAWADAKGPAWPPGITPASMASAWSRCAGSAAWSRWMWSSRSLGWRLVGRQCSECHCKHVSFLISKDWNIGKDVVVERLDRLTDQWYEFDETAAGTLHDRMNMETDVAGLRVEQAQYHENVGTAFCKQQQVIDRLLELVNDMSGRLKGLEDRAERSSFTSDPELPAAPATAELVEWVRTLRGAMEEVKPMDRPVESAPYAPPRVDTRVLPFVPMFSESSMLGERKPPAGSMREEHVVVDLRNPTRETSAAARDLPTSTAHAVYAEEEIHTMEALAKEGADGHAHGRCQPSENLWAKEPATGIRTAGGSSFSKIAAPWGLGGTGPLPMEERDVGGVYSHSPVQGHLGRHHDTHEKCPTANVFEKMAHVTAPHAEEITEII